MKISIELLSGATKEQALDLVVDANVGPRIRARNFFNKSIRAKSNNIFVAVNEGQVIGLIGWYQDNGRWAGKALGDLFPHGKDIYWVSYFAVRESLRGQGIGTQLLTRLLREVKHLKSCELWVYTLRARVFYEKMGFKFVTRAIIEGEEHNFLKHLL